MRNLIVAMLLSSSFLLAQEAEELNATEDSQGETSAVEEPAAEEAPAAEPEQAVEAELTADAESLGATPAAEPAPEAEPAAPVEEEKLAGAAVEKAPEKAPNIAPVYVPKEMTSEQRLTAIQENIDTLANNMESTLLGKDDAPLAVSGYMAFRVKNFDYTEIAPVYGDDKARTQVDATPRWTLP